MEENEQPILSVSEISLSLKGVVEQVFSHIRVRGEISGLKTVSSGHTYFSLKDKDSVLSAICWRGRSKETLSALQEGLEVICTGKLSTYPGRSNYQMIVDSAEPAGIGALLKLLNERKEKLSKEGLFNDSHKQKIPFLPTNIGVITSPTGAVIRDIMHRLNERFPTHVFLYPVQVQGEDASHQIITAINMFNQIPDTGLDTPQGKISKPSVLIIARGGGSLEDLWCFNDEELVRAVYHSKIPIISAVGHETDTTLIDYVSDLRAPTPTGAAEKAVPVRSDLILQIQGQSTHLNEAIYNTLYQKKLQLNALKISDLSELINLFIQRLDDKTITLHNAFYHYFEKIKLHLETESKLLKSYSFHSILERGFALISSTSNKTITHLHDAINQNRLQITLQDGTFTATPILSSTQNSKSNTSQTIKKGIQFEQGNLFNQK